MASDTGIHILGGGTISPVRSHFALAAPAYGGTARALHALLKARGIASDLHLTKMASMGQSSLETNDDIRKLTEEIIADPSTRVVIFNVAVADFAGQVGDVPSGKYAERLRSRDAAPQLTLEAADKIVPLIKAARPDIFLVAFKTTAGAPAGEQIERGLGLMMQSQADLVLANDTQTRRNIVIAAGGQVLCNTPDREKAVRAIADTISRRFPRKKFKKSPRRGPKNDS